MFLPQAAGNNPIQNWFFIKLYLMCWSSGSSCKVFFYGWVIHRSVISGLINGQGWIYVHIIHTLTNTILWKWSGTSIGLKQSGRAAKEKVCLEDYCSRALKKVRRQEFNSLEAKQRNQRCLNTFAQHFSWPMERKKKRENTFKGWWTFGFIKNYKKKKPSVELNSQEFFHISAKALSKYISHVTSKRKHVSVS